MRGSFFPLLSGAGLDVTPPGATSVVIPASGDTAITTWSEAVNHGDDTQAVIVASFAGSYYLVYNSGDGTTELTYDVTDSHGNPSIIPLQGPGESIDLNSSGGFVMDLFSNPDVAAGYGVTNNSTQ